MIEERRCALRFRIPLEEEADIEKLRQRISRYVRNELVAVGITVGDTHLRYDGLFVDLTNLDLARSSHRAAIARGLDLLCGHEWTGDWPPLESYEYEL